MVITQDVSEIEEFYSGASIFITGGTGFLGKLIIEKLLRSCPRIKKIYILCRPKRGKEVKNRLTELFDDVLFDLVRKTDPEFQTKITLIRGDCSEINLGISQEDANVLVNQINIIFHSAATIRFDERLRKAAQINVRATRDLMLLAHRMKQLKAFVHVSTAYSNCVKHHIEEKPFEPPMNGDQLMTLLDICDEDMLNNITPRLIGDHPNTYIYTKAIAENVVLHNVSKLPVCIVRPSAIISTSKEPLAGWCNNAQGAIGIAADCLQGILHTLYCDESVSVPLVPADHVANMCIVAAWEVAQTWDKCGKNGTISSNTFGSRDEILIYNHSGCAEHALTWGGYMKDVLKYSHSLPTLNCLWTCFLIMTKDKRLYLLYQFLLQTLPAYIHDGLLFLIGKKCSLIKNYRRIHRTADLVSPFISREWKFENKNTQNLYAKLNNIDKKLFDFNMSNMSWSEYMENLVTGVRVYILKDPLATVPRARRRYKILSAVNKVLLIILLVSFLFFLKPVFGDFSYDIINIPYV